MHPINSDWAPQELLECPVLCGGPSFCLSAGCRRFNSSPLHILMYPLTPQLVAWWMLNRCLHSYGFRFHYRTLRWLYRALTWPIMHSIQCNGSISCLCQLWFWMKNIQRIEPRIRVNVRKISKNVPCPANSSNFTWIRLIGVRFIETHLYLARPARLSNKPVRNRPPQCLQEHHLDIFLD